jgi:hypothetical protein
VIPQFAGSVGVLVAAASLAIGLWRHRTDKRYEYITALRKTIISGKATLVKLQGLLSYELIYEMGSTIVDSKTVGVAIDEMYGRFFNPESGAYKEDATKGDIETFLNNQFPYVYVPIHTELIELFDKLAEKLQAEIEPYRFEYPSLTRVFLSVNQFYVDLERGYRMWVQTEDNWRRVIFSWHENKDMIDSASELRDRCVQTLVQYWYEDKFTNEQHDRHMECFRAIVRIVTASYLSKTDDQLVRIGKKERELEFVPPESTKLLSDDLNQALKGLEQVLSAEEKIEYEDQIKSITQRPWLDTKYT